MLPVLNSFIKNLFTTKSNEFKLVFLIGQASRPCSKIGIHLVNIRCKNTSSGAILPTLPKIASAARQKDHLDTDRIYQVPTYGWFVM